MKIVVVASKNPVKVGAARDAFHAMFPNEEFDIRGRSIDSDVSDQPMSDDETYQGAVERVERAKEQHPEADFWIGMESGITEVNGGMEVFGWTVVRTTDQAGQSRTVSLTIPPRMAELIRGGMDMASADDEVFNREDSGRGTGTMGLLTGEVLGRQHMFLHATICALVPFRNPDLF